MPLFLSCSHLESTLNPSSSLKFKNVFKSSFKTVFTLLVHLSAKLAFLAAVWWMRALERENTSMAAAWCSSSEQAAVLQNNSTTQRSSHNSLLSPPPPFPSKNIFSSSYMHHDPVRLSRMWTQSDSGSLVASRLLEIDPWIPLLLCSHAQFSCSESSREQLERRSDDCYNSQSDDNREKQVESSPVGAAAQCAGVSSWLLTAHSMSLQTFFPVSEESSTTAKPGTIQVLLEEELFFTAVYMLLSAG